MLRLGRSTGKSRYVAYRFISEEPEPKDILLKHIFRVFRTYFVQATIETASSKHCLSYADL